MNYTKTYESLQELNSSSASVYGKELAIKIGQCSAILSNKLQCWRASDVLIKTVTNTPTEEDPNAVTTTYSQMCNRHAAMDQNEYNKAVQDEQTAAIANAAVEADQAKAPVPVKK